MLSKLPKAVQCPVVVVFAANQIYKYLLEADTNINQSDSVEIIMIQAIQDYICLFNVIFIIDKDINSFLHISSCY